MQHHGAALRELTGDDELVEALARYGAEARDSADGVPPEPPGLAALAVREGPGTGEGKEPGASGDARPDFAALLAYAVELTRAPESVSEADVSALRRAGWDDEAILHACEVIAYYNFVNRLADGLGVTLEPDWPHPPIGEPPRRKVESTDSDRGATS